jgi:hypothetical protein
MRSPAYYYLFGNSFGSSCTVMDLEIEQQRGNAVQRPQFPSTSSMYCTSTHPQVFRSGYNYVAARTSDHVGRGTSAQSPQSPQSPHFLTYMLVWSHQFLQRMCPVFLISLHLAWPVFPVSHHCRLAVWPAIIWRGIRSYIYFRPIRGIAILTFHCAIFALIRTSCLRYVGKRFSDDSRHASAMPCNE